MTATTSRLTRAGWWLNHHRDQLATSLEYWAADRGLIAPRRPPGSSWDVQRFTDAYRDYMDTERPDDGPMMLRAMDRAADLEKRISQRQASRARRQVDGASLWRLRMAARLVFIPAVIGLALGGVIGIAWAVLGG